jgi:hypothetical protein
MEQGEFRAGAVERLHPSKWPWRAEDFWRVGLLGPKKRDIEMWRDYVKDPKDQLSGASLRDMQNAVSSQQIPAHFLVDVSNWMWSVKEDGYFVKLIRDANNKWSMRTRRDVQLTPPPSFLKGLEHNVELPSLMCGELVTCFTGCTKSDRNDTDRRTLLRNQQFKILNQIFHNKGPEAWVGLRVKIFAFPMIRPSTDYTMNYTVWNLFNRYRKVMLKTLHYHPHIGMCNFGALHSTQDAIDIFKSVVQMGLEGIVIVNPQSEYGGLLDHAGDDACNYFKLKQKIVRPGEELRATGNLIEKIKDGVLQREHQYTINIDKKIVFFTDQQERDSCAYVRIKYMERAPFMYDTFPCQSGYRHMHFATQHDMSVEVPAAEELTHEALVRQVLGVDDDSQLFNPRPFALDSAPESAARLRTCRSTNMYYIDSILHY